MKNCIKLRFITILFVTVCLTFSVFTGNVWSYDNNDSYQPQMALKVGVLYGKISTAKRVGLGFEVGIRPVTFPINENLKLGIELPFNLQVFQAELKLKYFSLMSQVTPSVRLTYTTESGLEISPYIGVGGGARLILGTIYYDKRLHGVLSFKIGTDVMLTKNFGIDFNYTRNSIYIQTEVYRTDEYGNYIGSGTENISVGFNHIGLSIILLPEM